jgi:hypothetical protein
MCENERGITLGNANYKILANIILEKKIKPYIKKLLGTIRTVSEMEEL